MKNKSITSFYLGFVTLLVCTTQVNAQKLQMTEVDLPVSKDAQKKGMYVNTTLTEDGNIRTYIAYDLKKGKLGFDVVDIDPTGKLVENASEIASPETAAKYGIEIPKPGQAENPAQGLKVLRLVTANGVLGKLKFEEGYFEPKYAYSKDYGAYMITYTPVLKGFKFVSENETESEMKLNIYAAHFKLEDYLPATYNIIEGLIPNTVGYFNQNAVVSFIGKDARYDKNSPNGSNVVITGQFDGKTQSFRNVKEHVMSYNVNQVTNGYDGFGNRSVLLSTLNAPSSIAAWKKWQADGKPLMTYMTFDTDGEVVENVTFNSRSVRGNFAVYGIEDAHYVVGNINSNHDKYARADVGSPTDFQVVKIKNGQVVNHEVISMDQIASMLVTPGGKKGKVKYKDLQFLDCQKATNGDLMVIAQSPSDYWIYQFDPSAKMNAVYTIPRMQGLTGSLVQTMESGQDMYFLFRAQNAAISMGLKRSVSRGRGYMKNTNFSRVDEVMSFGRVVKINPEAKSCSEKMDILDDVILGNEPIFTGATGELILPVRDAKKNYKMAVIN